MRHGRDHHRSQTAEQFDLFGTPTRSSAGWTPAWEALPSPARSELTALMTRLILEHAHNHSATVIEAACHEP